MVFRGGIMYFWEYVFISAGLAMDAFAVSICKGLTAGHTSFKNALITGLWFGGFQALMPAAGWLLGSQFKDLIAAVDHWIAFGLMLWLGISAIRSAGEEETVSDGFTPAEMFPLAVATSIDALAAGITFSFMDVDIVRLLLCIGLITAVFCIVGGLGGTYLGEKNRKRAQIIGGLVLIFIGIQILTEHLGII